MKQNQGPTIYNCTQVFHVSDIIVIRSASMANFADDLLAKAGEHVWVYGEEIDDERQCGGRGVPSS